ncbi:MAG TPA: NYN domain-containing protein [Thermoanaerobaculia bacterium]|nr:NYN domain-containing protein [Thermoanaerobaculia bacterium]
MPKRTVVLIDGQNLYHGAKDAWCPPAPAPPQFAHYGWPSYDARKIALALVNTSAGRALSECRFYTGVPSPKQNELWHGFWTAKLRMMKGQGIEIYKGHINPGGQEKGVDVSIAVDLVRLTYQDAYDVAIVVSADWDLAPAIKLARLIATENGRTPDFESASPYEPGIFENRGLPGTTWLKIDKAMYDRCRDYNEYRPWQFR